MPKSLTHSTSYISLRKRVHAILLHGQARIEREKVNTYWQTGRLIQNHILTQKNRADYGSQVVERLSKDLEMNSSVLWRTIKFYERFPILAARPESSKSLLTWTHYRSLITVSDDKKRLELETRARKQNWTTDALEAKIRAEIKYDKIFAVKQQRNGKSYTPLIPKRGSLYTFQVITIESIHLEAETFWVDLGFSTYHKLSGEKKFKAGEIIETRKGGNSYRLVKSKKSEDDLFTYKALVERIVDGDTLRVNVDLGFDNWTHQYFRLRELNAPEVGTQSGRRTTDFVKRELENVPFIILRSTRSDKYDRYLADVFYQSKEGEKFLNNELLAKRLATRM